MNAAEMPDWAPFVDCWQCGGEGFVSNCVEEWACVDPEGNYILDKASAVRHFRT